MSDLKGQGFSRLGSTPDVQFQVLEMQLVGCKARILQDVVGKVEGAVFNIDAAYRILPQNGVGSVLAQGVEQKAEVHFVAMLVQMHLGLVKARSEERRVGKECRYRGSPDHEKKKEIEELSVIYHM